MYVCIYVYRLERASEASARCTAALPPAPAYNTSIYIYYIIYIYKDIYTHIYIDTYMHVCARCFTAALLLLYCTTALPAAAAYCIMCIIYFTMHHL